jgi:FMN phosphatase YigB (HAD superfamily)
MAKCRFIFFDVGNTLLFPNRERILAPLPAEQHPSLEQWQALERRTKREFDQSMTSGRVDHSFWWTFHTYLLEECGASNDGVRDKLIEIREDGSFRLDLRYFDYCTGLTMTNSESPATGTAGCAVDDRAA